MTRIVFITDSHGCEQHYRHALDTARQRGCSAIVHGGDMLPSPRKGVMKHQKRFLKEFMPQFLDQCSAANIRFMGMFGNDDFAILQPTWFDLVAASGSVAVDLTTQWHELGDGFWIRGSSFVPDLPFGLKDWTLLDKRGDAPAPIERGFISDRKRLRDIEDLAAFFADRPTIEEHLDTLVSEYPGQRSDQAILVSHGPPFGMGLANLMSGEDVGSLALRELIDKWQPRLTLHGHIHESPSYWKRKTGAFKRTAEIGHTTCHQPGQRHDERIVIASVFEIDSVDVQAAPNVPTKIETVEAEID